MATKVLVPLLGEGVEEVIVTKWLKREGDAVREFDPLLEVNTDKVDTEIPAPASGTVLKIVTQEGATARVGEILALIGKPGESTETASVSSRPPPVSARHRAAGDSAAKSEAPSIPGKVGFVSPVVARMAAEYGVDLSRVQGTGLKGRITKNDVLKATGPVPSAGAPSMVQQAPPVVRRGVGDRLVKHTTIRRQIADHMAMSQKTSPHVLTVMEADLGRVTIHRDASKALFERDGVRLTFTAYFVAAIIAALKVFPMANSSWTEEGVLVHGTINIGMATSLGDDGLIVPVIKNADELSLLAIARSINDLADRARARKLQPEEVRGGTFTLTNHGIGGSLFAMPIINQPQCAILGTGAIQRRVVAISDAAGSDAFAVRPIVYLSLVFDHRILDGASADAFLAKVKSTLETWA